MKIELSVEAVEELAREVTRRVLNALPEPDTGTFVTPAEAAGLIRCKRQRVYDLISAGKLARYAEGGRTLLRRTDVLALVTCDRKVRR